MHITTVMYHYVRNFEHSKYPKIKGLNTDDFKSQIEYFKKNYYFTTVQECIFAIKNNKALPKNSIILTFDDGFIDHYNVVFPILVKNKIQGVFFPSAKPILENVILDTHKIHFILAKVDNTREIENEINNSIIENKEKYNLFDLEHYKKNISVSSRYDSESLIFIKRLLQTELPSKLRSNIINKLFTKYVTSDQHSFSNELYMRTNHLSEMIKNNMIIGSHCYNHYWLNSLNYNDQLSEINLSLKFLSDIEQDFNNLTICYPYGAYNINTLDILIKKNFKLGFTTKPGLTNLNKENNLTLERFDTNDFRDV